MKIITAMEFLNKILKKKAGKNSEKSEEDKIKARLRKLGYMD